MTPTYPGVYIQELESPVHPITGVATAIAAFVGYAERGPVKEPTTVLSFTDYTRRFGGLWAKSTMGYAVSQFFQNGGTEAVIVRAVDGTAKKGSKTFGGTLTLESVHEGAWSQSLLIRIDHDAIDPTGFNLWVKDTTSGFVEVIRNLPSTAVAANQIADQSQLVRVTALGGQPGANGALTPGEDPFDPKNTTLYDTFPAGVDGGTTDPSFLVPDPDDGTGMYALRQADLFNLLCIPPPQDASLNVPLTTTNLGDAAAFCAAQKALFIVDGRPAWTDPASIASTQLHAYLTGVASDSRPFGGIYFPYVRSPDPLQKNAVRDFPPCGMIAGVMARTDAARGVWKAPAGLDAGLSGIQELKVKLTDGENGMLNPLGLNCLRNFPAAGNVVWGARTLAGADTLASQWKYVPVRRTTNFIEESLFRGHAVGGVRAQRRAAVGVDPVERRGVHARPVPPGRVPGHDAAGGVPRQVRQGHDDADRHQQRRREHPRRASRRSSRPSS